MNPVNQYLLYSGMFWLLFAIPGFFYTRFMASIVEQIAARYRPFGPWALWLNYVPILGLFWLPISAVRISIALKKEFKDRGNTTVGGCGYIEATVMGLILLLMVGTGFLWLPWIIFWVAYWIKIRALKAQLSVITLATV